MAYAFYIVVYGFFGYLLERFINLIAYGHFYDNSLLISPVQPMYGIGVALTLLGFDLLKRVGIRGKPLYLATLLIAYLATAGSEFVSGTLYEHFYGVVLWDYRSTFPFCLTPYTCFVPTSMFALLAFATVCWIHPYLDLFLRLIPKPVKIALILIVVVDTLYTYKGVFM